MYFPLFGHLVSEIDTLERDLQLLNLIYWSKGGQISLYFPSTYPWKPYPLSLWMKRHDPNNPPPPWQHSRLVFLYNGSFKEYSFNKHYLAIPEYTGSRRNHFNETHGIRMLLFRSLPGNPVKDASKIFPMNWRFFPTLDHQVDLPTLYMNFRSA